MALPTVGAVFGVFRICCLKICNSFFMSKTMVRSECLGLVKHFDLIQTMIDPSTMVIRHFKNMRFFCRHAYYLCS